MTKQEAEQLGRQAAQTDVADRFVDEAGNIIDPASLHAHIVQQIVAKVETTAFSIRDLRKILECVEGHRNDFINSHEVEERLKLRFPAELGPPLRSVDEGDVAEPMRAAAHAYVHYFVERRKATGYDEDAWKPNPTLEEWDGDDD